MNAPPGLPLRRSISWALASNVVYAASLWGTVVVLAKLGSAELVGQFSFALAVTTPILLLSSLKLRQVQATDARGEYGFGDYLGLRLATTGVGLAVIAALALLGDLQSGTRQALLLLGLARGLDAVSDVCHGLLQKHERLDWVARSLLVKGPLSLAAFAAVLAATGSLSWALVAMAAVSALVLTTYDLPRAATLSEARGPAWRAPVLWRLVCLTAPLGLTLGLDAVAANVPRYVLQAWYGEREVGLYSAASYFAWAGSTVIGALGYAAAPRLARLHHAGDFGEFDRLLGRLVAIGAGLGLGGAVVVVGFGRQILTALYGAEYATSADAFVWLMVGAGLRYGYVFLGSAINAMRDFRRELPIRVGSVAVAGGLCLALVDRYGMTGVAWAVAITAVYEGAAYVAVTVHDRRTSRPQVGGGRPSRAAAVAGERVT